MSFYVARRGAWQSRPFPAPSAHSARRVARQRWHCSTVVRLAA